MPTAARLFAALAFGLLGYLAAGIGRPLLPDGTQTTWFLPYSAAVGAIVGWAVMGGLVGRGYRSAGEAGIRTGLSLVFWGLLGLSIYRMVNKSMDKAYKGVIEAILGIFDGAYDYLYLMLNAPLIITLLVGSVLGGLLAEWASRRWR